MARTVRDAKLESRTARARLKARPEPYWRAVEQGAHLGYYKGPRGGTWVARYFLGKGYAKTRLGTADDTLDPDGAEVLGFAEAQAKAQAWFAAQARQAAGLEPVPTGPYTVADALRDYLAAYKAGLTKGKGRSPAATTAAINGLILPTLGEKQAARLTTDALNKWLAGLAANPARARNRKGAALRYRKVNPKDPEANRRRQATANRVLTVLKAALNHAWRVGKLPSDDAWRRVKPFHHVEQPVVRYLTEDECRRLANGCPADFRPMVLAALLTGCRYGELVALRVADFNPDSGTLAVRTSKSGKARHVFLTEEGQEFFKTAVAGRNGADLLLPRPDGSAWGKNHQQRPLAEACKRAKIAPAVSFHVLRHTHGSTLAMKGVPLPVIAKQLGHADTRMTERHYAHLAPSYVADTIRANFPKLGIVKPSRVVAINRK